MTLISLDDDGFKSLWYPPTHATISPTCQFEIKDYPSWAQQYMPHSRFIQICATFHPENGTSKERDKYHQLRNAVKKLNKATKGTFVPGKEILFNKGNIASQSNYNPVRKYFFSKPDKYRIDFFILADASNGHKFIYDIDIYQGKNVQNISTDEDLRSLSNTQKAVVNIIVSTGLI